MSPQGGVPEYQGPSLLICGIESSSYFIQIISASLEDKENKVASVPSCLAKSPIIHRCRNSQMPSG